MRLRTKKRRRISSVAALQEAEGAVPRGQESGRNRPSLAVGSAAQVGRAPVVGSAAHYREQHPADPVPEALAQLGVRQEVRHRALVAAADQGLEAARSWPPAPAAAAPVPRKRQPRALRSPPVRESRGERNRARPRPSRVPVLARLPERRAPKKAPTRRAEAAQQKGGQPAVAPVPVPRAGLRLAEEVPEAERAPVRRAAPGDRFSFPRAQPPRRGYSLVAAPFAEYYCRYGHAFSFDPSE